MDVKIEGLSDGGQYSNGLGTNNNPDTGTGAKIIFAVTSDGYTGTTLGTVARTSYGIVPSHTPYSTQTIAASSRTGSFTEGETITQAVTGATAVVLIPSSAGPRLFVRSVAGGTADNSNVWSGASGTLTPSATPATYYYSYREYEDGTNLTVRLSLSEPVYADDTLTVNILSGFYTEAGGDGGTANNATTSTFAVTNNSTLDYPNAFFQWDTVAGVRTADRVSGNYVAAVNAFHGWGVAAVVLDATGLTSGATDTETVTTMSQARRTGSGLYMFNHSATLNVAGFTSGERIKLRARIYPKIGDADNVFDSNGRTTATEEPRGYNESVIVYNSTPKYAYVDVVSGSNANTGSTNLATAIANPIQHIGKAIQNDCTVIYLKTGQTHPAIGTESSTRRTTNEWYVVQNESGGNATVQIGTTRGTKCERLQFKDIASVTLATTLSWLSGDAAANYIRYTGCNFDSTGVAQPSGSPAYAAYGGYFENCTGDLGKAQWNLDDIGATAAAFQFDGCAFNADATGVVRPWHRAVACSGTSFYFGTKTSTGSITQDCLVLANNRFYSQLSTSYGAEFFTTYQHTIGVAVVGNIWERTTSGNPPLWFSADARTVNCDNAIVCNNTSIGDRWNYGYNDNADGSLRTLKNVFSRNNISSTIATKHDSFGTPSGARVGAYWALYGVGHSGNFWPQTTGLTVPGDFAFVNPGIKSYQPVLTTAYPPTSAANATALTFPKFVNYAAYSGSTGAGSGDYRIHTNSPAYGLATGTEPFFPYDLNGKPRSRNNDNPGAIAEGGARRASMFFAN